METQRPTVGLLLLLLAAVTAAEAETRPFNTVGREPRSSDCLFTPH